MKLKAKIINTKFDENGKLLYEVKFDNLFLDYKDAVAMCGKEGMVQYTEGIQKNFGKQLMKVTTTPSSDHPTISESTMLVAKQFPTLSPELFRVLQVSPAKSPIQTPKSPISPTLSNGACQSNYLQLANLVQPANTGKASEKLRPSSPLSNDITSNDITSIMCMRRPLSSIISPAKNQSVVLQKTPTKSPVTHSTTAQEMSPYKKGICLQSPSPRKVSPFPSTKPLIVFKNCNHTTNLQHRKLVSWSALPEHLKQAVLNANAVKKSAVITATTVTTVFLNTTATISSRTLNTASAAPTTVVSSSTLSATLTLSAATLACLSTPTKASLATITAPSFTPLIFSSTHLKTKKSMLSKAPSTTSLSYVTSTKCQSGNIPSPTTALPKETSTRKQSPNSPTEKSLKESNVSTSLPKSTSKHLHEESDQRGQSVVATLSVTPVTNNPTANITTQLYVSKSKTTTRSTATKTTSTSTTNSTAITTSTTTTTTTGCSISANTPHCTVNERSENKTTLQFVNKAKLETPNLPPTLPQSTLFQQPAGLSTPPQKNQLSSLRILCMDSPAPGSVQVQTTISPSITPRRNSTPESKTTTGNVSSLILNTPALSKGLYCRHCDVTFKHLMQFNYHNKTYCLGRIQNEGNISSMISRGFKDPTLSSHINTIDDNNNTIDDNNYTIDDNNNNSNNNTNNIVTTNISNSTTTNNNNNNKVGFSTDFKPSKGLNLPVDFQVMSPLKNQPLLPIPGYDQLLDSCSPYLSKVNQTTEQFKNTKKQSENILSSPKFKEGAVAQQTESNVTTRNRRKQKRVEKDCEVPDDNIIAMKSDSSTTTAEKETLSEKSRKNSKTKLYDYNEDAAMNPQSGTDERISDMSPEIPFSTQKKHCFRVSVEQTQSFAVKEDILPSVFLPETVDSQLKTPVAEIRHNKRKRGNSLSRLLESSVGLVLTTSRRDKGCHVTLNVDNSRDADTIQTKPKANKPSPRKRTFSEGPNHCFGTSSSGSFISDEISCGQQQQSATLSTLSTPSKKGKRKRLVDSLLDDLSCILPTSRTRHGMEYRGYIVNNADILRRGQLEENCVSKKRCRTRSRSVGALEEGRPRRNHSHITTSEHLLDQNSNDEGVLDQISSTEQQQQPLPQQQQQPQQQQHTIESSNHSNPVPLFSESHQEHITINLDIGTVIETRETSVAYLTSSLPIGSSLCASNSVTKRSCKKRLSDCFVVDESGFDGNVVDSFVNTMTALIESPTPIDGEAENTTYTISTANTQEHKEMQVQVGALVSLETLMKTASLNSLNLLL